MTRSTNARIAGVTFLVYIAAGLTAMTLGPGPLGSGVKLAGTVASLLSSFSALVLGVTLYGITREEDHELAMLAMLCRVGEGVIGAMPGTMLVPATFFAVGSTIFAWLLLRGRMIPAPLALLGVAASLLTVVAMPLQLAGFVGGTAARLVWAPMLAFEVPLALWLIFRGVAAPARLHPSGASP